MISPKRQRFAQRRQTHEGLHQHPWLASWNPHETKENLLMRIRETQHLGLLNRTQHCPSQSTPLPMPCIIASLKDTKMDYPQLHLG